MCHVASVECAAAVIVPAVTLLFANFDTEDFMFAIQKLEEYLRTSATPAASRELSRLLDALREEKEFPLSSLYEIDYEAFELAVEVLRDWRIDRYYAKDTQILDRAVQSGASELNCTV
jgi:negative regulator of replication initiation